MARFSISISILERPITVGFLISALTGEVFPVLYIAAFFELLWIDIIPAGTFIPPNAIFCVLATVTVVHIFNLDSASQIFPVMAATIPIAFTCSWLEGIQRTSQNKNYNIILQQSRKKADHFRPGKMIRNSILQLLMIYLLVGVLGIYGLVLLLDAVYLYLSDSLCLSWAFLLMIASISALAALRIKRAYASLVMGMIIVSGYLAWEYFGM